MTPLSPLPYSSPVSPFAFRDYRLFWAAKFAGTVASLLMVVVIGWQVYDLARRTMAPKEAAFVLGMVGLAQFLPLLLLNPFVGLVADRFDRRWIARASEALQLGCALVLAVGTRSGWLPLPGIFVVAALLGVARAFASPALSALAPNLVPRKVLPRAVAMNSMAWQSGAILAPPLGGYLYAAAPFAPYASASALLTFSLAALMFIRPVPRPPRASATPFAQIAEGVRYVRNNRVVLGAISLDLFAVILGGATALLPIYARDILHVGAAGLGNLRAAPAIGATATALFLARRSLGRSVGLKIFVAVGLFGAATVVFGLSRNMALSLGALAVIGAADMVSVYVRQSLIQIHTPDAMRGRVAAVSSLFISASNELGEFESGVVASAIGPVAAAVVGGAGAVLVAILWARGFPELRRADTLGAPDTVG